LIFIGIASFIKIYKLLLTGFIMIKRGILAVLILIFLCSFVSAVYVCSDGSQIITDSREINEFSKKIINGLGIAVINADEVPAINRITADLIVDAEKVSLSNETPSEEIELLVGTYNITLVNATNDKAEIKIDSLSKEFNEKEVDTLNSLQVFVVEANREPSVLTADVIIGGKRLLLSNDGNISQIVRIKGKNYSVELISASDDSANIRVGRCGTGDILEEQVQSNQSSNNESAGNESGNLTAGNETSQNLTNLTSQNLTNVTNNVTGNITANTTSKKTSIIASIWFWVLVIAIVAIIVAFIIYRKMKSYKEESQIP